MQGFPRRSYYGKHHVNKNTRSGVLPKINKPASKPAQKNVVVKKKLDSFEAEYQEFIRKLKEKKEAEKKAETNVEPVVEEQKTEEPVVEEPKPAEVKKTRKKGKKEVVEETEEQ